MWNFLFQTIHCNEFCTWKSPTITTFYTDNPYFFTTFSKFVPLLFPYFSVDGHLKACSECTAQTIIWALAAYRRNKYNKTCVERPLSKRPQIGFQDQLTLNEGQKYCRMLPLEYSAILLTFIKLPFVIKIFVLSIFEWPFYLGFTVLAQIKVWLLEVIALCLWNFTIFVGVRSLKSSDFDHIFIKFGHNVK